MADVQMNSGLAQANLQNVARMLLRKSPEAMAANSFRKYHAERMDYLCLERSENSTLKLYFIWPDHKPDGMHGALVDPHDHAYDFSTTVLAGGLENLTFSERSSFKASEACGVYKYKSPLAGGLGFGERGMTALSVPLVTTLRPGESYFLSHEVIHTIRPMAGVFTLLLLHQQANQPKPFTKFYTNKPNKPNTSELYWRMEPHYAADLVHKVCRMAVLGHDMEIAAA